MDRDRDLDNNADEPPTPTPMEIDSTDTDSPAPKSYLPWLILFQSFSGTFEPVFSLFSNEVFSVFGRRTLHAE